MNKNQIKPFFALFKASFTSTFRNRTTVFFNFLFPFVFITIFGILGNSNIKLEIGVRPESLTSGPIYEAINKVEVFKLIPDSNQVIDDKLKKGQLPVAITITQNENLFNIQLDQSTATQGSAETIAMIISNIVAQINRPQDPSYQELVTLKTNQIEGRTYRQIDYVLPGQLAFAILMNALFGIGFSLVVLRKELVLKRIFATPTSRLTIIFAESLSRVVLAIMQAVVIILVGHFLFKFTLADGAITFINMLILSLIGIVVFLGFGLLIPGISKDENSVSVTAQLIMMPQLFLSGAFFQIEAFPLFVQNIAHLLPMTFLNEAFKKVAFEGLSILDCGYQIGGMLIWAIVLYAIDVKIFKWE